jgi:hypothetical protein
VTQHRRPDAITDHFVHADLLTLAIDKDIHASVAGNALVNDQQINSSGWALVEHADGLEVNAKLMPLVLRLDLAQEILPHSNPSNSGGSGSLQLFRDK